MTIKRPEGAFLLWKWIDQEIDDPKTLRKQLLKIAAKRFSGVVSTLGDSRYELVDQAVLRAVSRVSQWAKKREIAFWLNADPRRASRAFITKTGERMQALIVTKKSNGRLEPGQINIVQIKNDHFRSRVEIPRMRKSASLQEVALFFEPSELERAFLFQKKGNTILTDSLRDITAACHFSSNLAEGYSEIFGHVRIPKNETWWVLAFPKYNTNAYDFAGRESNDLMAHFVEDLFDACTHLNGVLWGGGSAGYIADSGRFPVSLSLFNCFKAEYRYDLRDFLYALVLDTDNASHIRIRCDYYELLMKTVFSAQTDFYSTIHSFFRGVESGLQHSCPHKVNAADGLVQGVIDPWQSLKYVDTPFFEVGDGVWRGGASSHFLSQLMIAKSLGVFSSSQKAYAKFDDSRLTEDQINHLTDLLCLFSVQWVSEPDVNHGRLQKQKSEESIWPPYESINKKIERIRSITGFRFPEANVAVIYPVETIMAGGSRQADEVILTIHEFISTLVNQNIQLDVVSTTLLKEGRASGPAFRIRNREYDAILFPYPEVMSQEVLEIIKVLRRRNFPVLLGGCRPRFTIRGKRIPLRFPVSFDPKNKDLSSLWDLGIRPMISGPKNALYSALQIGDNEFICICPKKSGGIVEGELTVGDSKMTLKGVAGFAIFEIEGNTVVKRRI